MASIGGAGTFDGIFLSGIVAVLLTPRRAAGRSGPVAGKHRRNSPYQLRIWSKTTRG